MLTTELSNETHQCKHLGQEGGGHLYKGRGVLLGDYVVVDSKHFLIQYSSKEMQKFYTKCYVRVSEC